jgi:hypothetical protein
MGIFDLLLVIDFGIGQITVMHDAIFQQTHTRRRSEDLSDYFIAGIKQSRSLCDKYAYNSLNAIGVSLKH